MKGTLPFFFGGFFLSLFFRRFLCQAHAEPKGGHGRAGKQRPQAVTKGDPGEQPPNVRTLIRGQHLRKPVDHQWKQQKKKNRDRQCYKQGQRDGDEDPQKLPRTAGA